MSAELLRRAAAVLRAFPAVSHNERWCTNYVHGAIRHIERNVEEESFNSCEDHREGCGHFGIYDGKYVATMDPPVALAVADLLDSLIPLFDGLTGRMEHEALTLARAILREES